jgi:hypothetical protein
MKPTVYIETTVVSYLTAWPSREPLRAAHQQVTRDWWNGAASRYELYSSVLVVTESLAGDAAAAAERKVILDTLPLLEQSVEAEALAEALVRELAIPPESDSRRCACGNCGYKRDRIPVDLELPASCQPSPARED